MKTFKEWLNEQEINESATVIRWVDALDFSGEAKWQKKFSPKYITFRNDKKSIISRYSS